MHIFLGSRPCEYIRCRLYIIRLVIRFDRKDADYFVAKVPFTSRVNEVIRLDSDWSKTRIRHFRPISIETRYSRSI